MVLRPLVASVCVLLHLANLSGTKAGSPSFSPEEAVVCPGDQITFNCTVVDSLGTQTTIWNVNTTLGNELCVLIHAINIGESCTTGTGDGLIVEVDGDCYSSTLHLTVTQDLDNAVVQCFSPLTVDSDLAGSGILKLLDVVPLPPTTLQYTVLEYGQEQVNISIEWVYPPDGPRVDSYTVTVTNAMAEVVISANISEGTSAMVTLPYNQALTVSVTATNCAGSSTETSVLYFEASCGIPGAPRNGHLVEFGSSEEGAVAVYECNPGLLPTGENTTTCTGGNWTPDPAELLCTCPGSENAFSPEYRAACPGDLVIFTCVVVDPLGSQTTLWKANTTTEQCAVIHAVPSVIDDCGPFQSRLGAEDVENDCFPSTLTTVVTNDLNNTLIECFSPTLSDRIGSGVLVIEKDVPLPIANLTYSVTSYGREAVSILLQWTYPSEGPQVDAYTLTVTSVRLASPIVLADDKTQFTLTNFYYNSNYTISVTASNCNGPNTASTLDYFERGCEIPQPPLNGTIVEFESAQDGANITYRCDNADAADSFFITEPLPLVAVCTSGGWDPDPAYINCTVSTTEGSSGANIYIVGGGIIGGAIILLVLQTAILIYCLIKVLKTEE